MYVIYIFNNINCFVKSMFMYVMSMRVLGAVPFLSSGNVELNVLDYFLSSRRLITLTRFLQEGENC